MRRRCRPRHAVVGAVRIAAVVALVDALVAGRHRERLPLRRGGGEDGLFGIERTVGAGVVLAPAERHVDDLGGVVGHCFVEGLGQARVARRVKVGHVESQLADRAAGRAHDGLAVEVPLALAFLVVGVVAAGAVGLDRGGGHRGIAVVARERAQVTQRLRYTADRDDAHGGACRRRHAGRAVQRREFLRIVARGGAGRQRARFRHIAHTQQRTRTRHVLQPQHRSDDAAQRARHLRLAAGRKPAAAGQLVVHQGRVEGRLDRAGRTARRYQQPVGRNVNIDKTVLAQIAHDSVYLRLRGRVVGQELLAGQVLAIVRTARVIHVVRERLQRGLVA